MACSYFGQMWLVSVVEVCVIVVSVVGFIAVFRLPF